MQQLGPEKVRCSVLPMNSRLVLHVEVVNQRLLLFGSSTDVTCIVCVSLVPM